MQLFVGNFAVMVQISGTFQPQQQGICQGTMGFSVMGVFGTQVIGGFGLVGCRKIDQGLVGKRNILDSAELCAIGGDIQRDEFGDAPSAADRPYCVAGIAGIKNNKQSSVFIRGYPAGRIWGCPVRCGSPVPRCRNSMNRKQQTATCLYQAQAAPAASRGDR